MRLDLKELRDTARGAPCSIDIPGVCNGMADTTVWAHANLLAAGKGLGIKAADPAGCHACSACHAFIDQGTAPFEIKLAWFVAGMVKTYTRLFERGELRVCKPGAVEVVTAVKSRLRRKSQGRTTSPSKILRHPGVPV